MDGIQIRVGSNGIPHSLQVVRGNPVIGIKKEQPVKTCYSDTPIARRPFATLRLAQQNGTWMLPDESFDNRSRFVR